MKSAISLLLIIVMAAAMFVGCEEAGSSSSSHEKDTDTTVRATAEVTEAEITTEAVESTEEQTTQAEEAVPDEPIYEAIAEEPVAEEPITEEIVFYEPIVEEPNVEEPVIEEPAFEEPKNTLVWNEELQNRIKKAYAKVCEDERRNRSYTADDVFLRQYFGIYNDAVPMFIGLKDDSYCDWLVNDTVDGVEFKYVNGDSITVWKDDKFYSLQKAFNEGILTHDDLVAIATIQNEGKDF